MYSGKLPTATLNKIVEMKRDGMKAWKILESDELKSTSSEGFRFPDPIIDGNVTTLPFANESIAKMAEKEMKDLANERSLNVQISVKGNKLIVTNLDEYE